MCSNTFQTPSSLAHRSVISRSGLESVACDLGFALMLTCTLAIECNISSEYMLGSRSFVVTARMVRVSGSSFSSLDRSVVLDSGSVDWEVQSEKNSVRSDDS